MNEGAINVDDALSDQELMQQTIDNLRHQNKQIFSSHALKHPLDIIEDFCILCMIITLYTWMQIMI